MKLGIIIPCFNEQAVLPYAVAQLIPLYQTLLEKSFIDAESTITFIDDGSTDDTWKMIVLFAKQHTCIHGIKLAKNRGHQSALIAGLLNVPGDILISLDADLQDDLSAIEAMILAHREGAEIVYGVRDNRETDTVFKKISAELYYHLLKLLRIDVIFNHADYRLMSRKAIKALAKYSEVNLFLRGIIPQLGFTTKTVFYKRNERIAGQSKYPLSKMLALAWEGLTSFSSLPLRWITFTGFIVSIISFGIGLWALISTVILNKAIPGWASTVIPMYFLGGIQLLSLGIIGEYIAKIYSETKKRPRYIIEKKL